MSTRPSSSKVGAAAVLLAGVVLCALPGFAAPFTVVITDPSVTHVAKAGRYITYLDPDPYLALAAGASAGIRTLYGNDYPGYAYQAGTGRNGVLTISRLDAFQDGTQGGLDIIASFAGDPAPEIYRWIQYIEMSSISPPFRGATSSPFTDPPPDDRDDNAPFYETELERMTEGVGYVTGGNINNNPRFWDSPRANDTRAPLTFHLNLFLTDHSSPANVTIFDGIQYGFRIEEIPEPSTLGLIILGLGAMLLGARRRTAGSGFMICRLRGLHR